MYFSKNPIPITLVTTQQNQPNFHFESVFVRNGRTEAFLKGKPDAQGEYVMDISDIANAFASPAIPQNLPGSTPEKNNNAVVSFSMIHYEKYGDPINTSFNSSTALTYTLYAGLSHVDFPGNGLSYFQGKTHAWLTWQPQLSTILAESPGWLYYLHLQNSNQLYAHYVLMREDGSQYATHYTSFEPDYGDVHLLPLRLKALFPPLSDEDFADIASLRVFVSSSTDPDSTANKSSEREFVIDDNYYPHVRYFIYQNSLSGFDTLSCTGAFQQSSSVEKQEARRVLPVSYTPDQAEYLQFRSRERSGRKGSTGWVSAEKISMLREFLASENIQEVIGWPHSPRLAPVSLRTNSARLLQDDNNLHSLEFEYDYAFANRAVSHINPL